MIIINRYLDTQITDTVAKVREAAKHKSSLQRSEQVCFEETPELSNS